MFILTAISKVLDHIAIDNNFKAIANEVNNELLKLDPDSGQDNTMKADLDMNSNDILNVKDVDVQGLKVAGQNLSQQFIDVDTKWHEIKDTLLPAVGVIKDETSDIRDEAKDWAIKTSGPVDGVEYSSKWYAQKAADERHAFSPISWHDQSIENSVTIPDNVNAWSFGPAMVIAEGQQVTVGEGSFWTIANGEVQ